MCWALLGATGVGKTGTAVQLAEVIPLEVVGLDSRQLYVGMDIGTSKPTPAQQAAVRHHVIDVIAPDIRWDAMTYARAARDAIRQIADRGARPLVVGGSGFYFAALSGQLNEDLPPRDDVLRGELRHDASVCGSAALWERLRTRDPDAAQRIHPNDTHRIMRALEIVLLTGKPLGEHASLSPPTPWGSWNIVVLTLSRERLRTVLGERVTRMVRGGWIDEVRGLLAAGVDPSSPGMTSLGYPEMVDHVRGRLSLEDAVARIINRTWQYAKRQMTWFRRFPAHRWVELDDTPSSLSTVLHLLQNGA